MARKNEFRMDPDRSGGWGRWLLTRRQQLQLLRWSLYALVCLAALLAQDAVLYRVDLRGAGTDIVPCVILMIAVLQDADSGSLFTLVASTLYYFSGSAPGAYCIPMLTGLGILLIIFRQSYLRQGFFAALLCAAIGMLTYEMGVFCICLFLGQVMASRVGIMSVTALLSLAAVPVTYPMLRAIGKIGGEVWKE